MEEKPIIILGAGATKACGGPLTDDILPAALNGEMAHEYREKFYVPYRAYPRDIYAIPGNHDWYDELVGFMIHFCDNLSHFSDERQTRRTVDPEKLAKLRAIR
jgi:hypothetical protein